MKVVLVITMIAFVAVQLSHSVPVPEEESKDANVEVAADPSTAQPAVEAKSTSSDLLWKNASVSPSVDVEKDAPADAQKA